MIFGIGTDIVKISRIEEMKSLSRFTEKILSPEELILHASGFEGVISQGNIISNEYIKKKL